MIFGLLLAAGFFYRLYFSSLATPDLVWDMAVYDGWAKDFLYGRFPIDCCLKNVGYGAFLSVIYAVFGVGNLAAVRFVQIMLDTGTAVFVFFVARQLGGTRSGRFAFLLYLANPFTAAFTGLILAEVWTLFLLMTLVYLVGRRDFSGELGKKGRWPAFAQAMAGKGVWGICGLLLGLLLFTRHSLLLWSVSTIILFAVFVISMGRRFVFLTICSIGFLLASSYSLIRYSGGFGKIALVPPYSMRAILLYTTFFGGKYPELDFYVVHPEFERLAIEYDTTPIPERAAWSEQVMQQFWQKMETDWPLFVQNYVQRIIWIWDKDHLFQYRDPWFPQDRFLVQLLNVLLLGMAGLGAVRYVRKKGKTAFRQPVFIMTVALFLSITVFFPLVSSESRHSLVFYPLLCVWGGVCYSRKIPNV